MDYRHRSHSKTYLGVHLIFACKYRKDLLSKLKNEIKMLMYHISDYYDFNISEMEVDNNHIHILVEYSPVLSVTKIVQLLKGMSTYKIWRLSDKITNFLSKTFLEGKNLLV